MLRIIIRQQSVAAAVHVIGAETEHDFKTFDVSLPEVEKYLREGAKWNNREIIGVELLEDNKPNGHGD